MAQLNMYDFDFDSKSNSNNDRYFQEKTVNFTCYIHPKHHHFKDIPEYNIGIVSRDIVTISSDVADFKTIQNEIANLLAKTDCVKYMYYDCCKQWYIQYGTQPLVNSLSEQPISTMSLYSEIDYYYCKLNALKCAKNIINITRYLGVSPFYFKNLGVNIDFIKQHGYMLNEIIYVTAKNLSYSECFDDFECLPISILNCKKWSSSCLFYTKKTETNEIVVSYQRLLGDRNSYYFLERLLKTTVSTNNFYFMRRRGYISLVDGVDKDYIDTNDANFHIWKYLFDYNVHLAICSYI